MLAVWERGYRCHGYWLNGSRRLGLVFLGPRGIWDGVYRWEIDGTETCGEEGTLRAAKRAVERAAELVVMTRAELDEALRSARLSGRAQGKRQAEREQKRVAAKAKRGVRHDKYGRTARWRRARRRR